MILEKQNLHRYAHFRIDLGLNEAQQDVQSEVPELVQYDNNSGVFVFDFFNLGKRIDVSKNVIVLNFLLPNNDLVSRMIDSENKQGSRAIFYTPGSILSQAGIVQGTVTVFENDKNTITSPIRFQFKVQEGIESEGISNSDDVPVLQQLIGEVQQLQTQASEWNETLEQEYNKQQEDFDNLQQNAQSQFIATIEEWNDNYEDNLIQKSADYDRFLGQNQTEFQEQLTEQQAEFQGLVDQFDEAFNGFDMGGAFEQKFAGLEEEYAEQYAETKRITHEIYTTTLTYRFVEDEEEQE